MWEDIRYIVDDFLEVECNCRENVRREVILRMADEIDIRTIGEVQNVKCILMGNTVIAFYRGHDIFPEKLLAYEISDRKKTDIHAKKVAVFQDC